MTRGINLSKENFKCLEKKWYNGRQNKIWSQRLRKGRKIYSEDKDKLGEVTYRDLVGSTVNILKARMLKKAETSNLLSDART